MNTYLVTGAAGFIGANFIKYLLHDKYKNEEIKVIVLDALTYAGNLGTIKDDIDGKRCVFVKGDIRDRALADQLFGEYDIDYVVNFAAESHVDRSIEDPQLFLSVNIQGKTCWTLPVAHGSQARTNRDIRRGSQESATIRYRPTRSMALLATRATSRRKRPCVPTVPIRRARLPPT